MNTFDLPVERPLRLYVNETEIATLMATPEKLKELAFGWLWSNQLISTAGDVREMMVDINRSLIWAEIASDLPVKITRTITSGCGGGETIARLSEALPKIDSTLKITADKLSYLMLTLLKNATIYKKTGGVHGAALADAEELLYMAEDIGRHNAVDKTLGWALIGNLDLKDKIILTTGRVSSEMLVKAARAGLPIVGSRTAATDLAIDLARESGVTVAGYIRKGSTRAYSHPERIVDS